MTEKRNASRKSCAKTDLPDFGNMATSPKPTYHLFKEALIEALSAQNMTAAALATKASVNRSRISEFTQGLSLPKDDTIVAICSAFPAIYSKSLAKAWTQERLGPSLSASILASDSMAGTPLESLFFSLPTDTQKAFSVLMAEARIDDDIRSSLVRLAAYVAPSPTNISYFPTGGGHTVEALVAEEHAKDDAHEGQH